MLSTWEMDEQFAYTFMTDEYDDDGDGGGDGNLLVPCARTATGQRRFAVNGPATWNCLPPALRSPDLSESPFKMTLKTHLFSTARRY